MLALLRTRRWISFTILVIVVIVAFGLLSRWQWSRAQDKRLQRQEVADAIATAPASVDQVLGAGYVDTDEWRRVAAAGVWDPSAQVLVRRRPLAATNGFWVMTPLRTDSGHTAWVNRGWIAATGAAQATIEAPPPAEGHVTVTGYLRAFEIAEPQAGLPQGQVPAPALAVLPDQPQPLPAYLQLESPAQQGLTPLPTPAIDEGQNISYAVQWLLFAAVAVGGWFFFLRREAREDVARTTTPPRG